MRKRSPSTRNAGAQPGSATALVRGLHILRAFTASDKSLGNQDLLDRTGLPKATVSRLTAVLTALGYLDYDENLGRYSIGAATIALGYGALSTMPIVRVAQPILDELAESTGGSTAIGRREGIDMIYLVNSRAAGPVSLRLNTGSRLPMWCSAMGLSWMAAQNTEERARMLKRLIASEPAQEAIIRQNVEKALEEFRRHGSVTTFGTWYSYINAVGIPLLPRDGSPLMVLTCGGIVDILPREQCEGEVREKVHRAASKIIQTLS
ncbi:IclR family transcriptional regulator [Falsochrobactrum shanghaiense]|uniref:IclR family transcriptional regulator n=1 Tax=Falsochrobactrum shanghaiense TaxID=2201899 RepID=A0A316JLX6_9HYPH|nr:IclR family transcriptional regulator [Falsochrobactrum shanghaiense]PWL16210.1 IclR family transcriptional regulator [Falsochrobactrum shanghaiense]